jgi:hypothetical protein
LMMLSLDTAYRSFGGEVEASSTPTICRLPDSRRHQLSAIARHEGADHLRSFERASISLNKIFVLVWILRFASRDAVIFRSDGGCRLFLAFLHSRKAAACQRDAQRHDSQNTHFADPPTTNTQAQPAIEGKSGRAKDSGLTVGSVGAGAKSSGA